MLQIIQKLKDKREERLSNRSFANGCEILGVGVRNVEKEAKLLSSLLLIKGIKLLKNWNLLMESKVFLSRKSTPYVL